VNSSLLDTYLSSTQPVRSQIRQFKRTPISLSRINKSGKNFFYDGKVVQTSALNDLLNIFSIKNDILREIHDDENQWIPLQKSLSKIKNDKIVTGITKTTEENTTITRFLKEKIQEESQFDCEHGFNLLEGYLGTAPESMQLHSLKFNEENLALEATFRDTNNTIDVFKDQKDLWQSGFSFLYGQYKTVVSPFLLRLICSNGMRATHHLSQRYFKNKGLWQRSFNKLINKTLSEDLHKSTTESCFKMRQHNASLREFLQARETCLEVSKELADTYFNDQQIQDAYKPYQIRYKNHRWLSSANSNMNAYEFFNRMTHCVSHQTSLPPRVGMHLNHLASEMFFKGPDISFQAPNPFLN
jgi:hypothetical protein